MPDDLNTTQPDTTTAAPDSTAPTTAPVQETSTPVQTGAWPNDWRETFAKNRGGDEKLVSRLSRYSSPEAALDALIQVQNKISAGELRSNAAYPANGTPEQQAEWRRMQGVPDAPDKYEVKLGDGLVIGEEDKPVVESFLKAAHAANMPNGQVNSLLKWYFDELVEGQQAARHARDEEVRTEVESTLKNEWGQDYPKNKAIIEAYLESGPPGVKDLLFGARLADGTPLASNVDVLRFLADKGRDYNPTISVVPGDPTTVARSIADELSNIQAMMGNKRSEYWVGPKADQLQKRYRELVGARDRINEKMSRAAS